MHVLWRVIVKEFLQIRRDRRMIPVIFVAPVVQILVFGFAVNTDVTDVPTVLVDQDRSAASRDLVSRFVESGLLRGRGHRGAGRGGGPLARHLGRAQLGLVLAPGFGAALAAGRTGRLQVIADGSDATSASVALGYAAALAQGCGAEVQATRSRAHAASARPARRPGSASSRASSTTPTSRAAGSTCPPSSPWSSWS